MTYKYLLIFVFTLPYSLYAFEDLKVSGEVIFDYRSDRVRTGVNTDDTNIRTVSVVLEKKTGKDSEIYFELLGDENTGQSGLDLSLGEVYFNHRIEKSQIGFDFKLGVMKLDYGVLNPIDGMFNKMPSYYNFMYGLPRGLDIGATATVSILNDKISFGLSGYTGKSLRATDQFQRKIYGQPYHMKVNYQIFEKNNISGHYFSREYEGTPKIRGYGLSYDGSFTYKTLQLSLIGEWMNLNSNIGSYTSSANAYLLFPKLQYQRFYIGGVIAREDWTYTESNNTSENYTSVRLGVDLLENVTFEVEQLKITDVDNNVNKEDSLLARILMQWSFN